MVQKSHFLTPNWTPSTDITSSNSSYHKENKSVTLDLIFASIFAWFSLYRLWKTCSFGQASCHTRIGVARVLDVSLSGFLMYETTSARRSAKRLREASMHAALVVFKGKRPAIF